jgi:hypothetical protein
MKDDLPKAYTAYQQALYHLPNPKVGSSFACNEFANGIARAQALVRHRDPLR